MAEVLPFPLPRRRDYVRRQAQWVLAVNPEAGERRIAKQVGIQRDTLLSRGIDPRLVDQQCSALEAAIRAELWRVVLAPEGAA